MKRRSFLQALAVLPGLAFAPQRGEARKWLFMPPFTEVHTYQTDTLTYGNSEGRTSDELAALADGQAAIEYQA